MKVKKRDGTLVPVRLDEITDRIASLSNELDQKIIDPVKITLEVVEKIHDGISTSLIDSFTAEICHSKSIEHPHFNVLAGRLIIGDHQKNIQIMTDLKFSEVCKLLHSNTDQLGAHSPLVSDELLLMCQENKDLIDGMIVNERDFLLDYFGFKTLTKNYLLRISGKVVETPQHMFMRVALGIHGKFKLPSTSLTLKLNKIVQELTDSGIPGEQIKPMASKMLEIATGKASEFKLDEGMTYEADFESVKETYDLLSMKYFTHATPTLFNAGTKWPQFFSCFLMGMSDSLTGQNNNTSGSIYSTLEKVAEISKRSGGIGIHVHDIRANGSYIRGTGGKGDGLVPMLKVYNDTARYVNQGGRRSGSFAIYLEPWHADIQDFLKLGLKHGDDNRRARDLFYALWIPDLFMERVKVNEPWSLMCPSECPGLANVYGKDFKKLYEKYEKEGRVVKTINAQDLWHEIIKSQIETGTPYMTYKDAANYKSNHKNIGTIRSSNLCVAPETRILTENGYFPIRILVDQYVKVWNGQEWSPTIVRKTGTRQKLIKVKLDNGSVINCTDYHKFVIETYDGTQFIAAKDLVPDMKLINYDLPVIMNGPDLNDKNIKEVPINHSYYSKMSWFEELFDKDGRVINEIIQIWSISREYLIDVQLMLHTIGINSNVRIGMSPDPDLYILYISAVDVQYLLNLGFCPKKFKFEKNTMNTISVTHYNKVVSIEDNGRIDDTYCFTENKRNMGVFEGVLLGNCSEIMEYSDTEKYACCVLASLVLPTYVVGSHNLAAPTTPVISTMPIKSKKKDNIIVNVSEPTFDHAKLAEVVKVITINLNKLIDINYYPVEETRHSNMSERPIGIGVQGLADVFFKMGIAYDSEEAIKLDREIMETIYFSAMSTSMELSKKHGPYATFKGSPISKGHFQFDLWKEFPTNKDQPVEIIHSGRHDWDKLRRDIKKYGVRNSLVTALMPTASTSQIMGSASEAFEPITSNCYTRRVKAGEFMIVNPYMAADLIKAGIWNDDMRQKLLNSRGSIQSFEEIPQQLKNIYKTVWEIQQKVLIDHSVARAPYIDQSQSLNLYFADGQPDKITKAHFYGWNKGLKTGSYYMRIKPIVNAVSFAKDDDNQTSQTSPVKKQPVIGLITGEDTCTSCGS